MVENVSKLWYRNYCSFHFCSLVRSSLTHRHLPFPVTKLRISNDKKKLTQLLINSIIRKPHYRMIFIHKNGKHKLQFFTYSFFYNKYNILIYMSKFIMITNTKNLIVSLVSWCFSWVQYKRWQIWRCERRVLCFCIKFYAI